MHNKVKSENSLAVTSAKAVAVFQASFKLVWEDPGAQLFDNDMWKTKISKTIPVAYINVTQLIPNILILNTYYYYNLQYQNG